MSLERASASAREVVLARIRRSSGPFPKRGSTGILKKVRVASRSDHPMTITDLEERQLRGPRRPFAPEEGLPQLLDALRWRWKQALVVAALFTVGAALYVESLPAQYDGKALLAISPRPSAPSASADTVRVIGPKYVAYVTARSTIAAVAPRIGEDPQTLEEAVDAA